MMNTNDDHGNLTYFPGEKWRREHSAEESGEGSSGEGRAPETDESPISGEVLLKTLEKPLESAGRCRRIARLREQIRAGRYHVPAIELAERMISGDII